MTDEISYDDRLWLSRISDVVSHAVEAGLNTGLILDAVAIGLELEQRTALWGGSPLSLSLARAFSSSVEPDALATGEAPTSADVTVAGTAGPTEAPDSSTARASRASTSYPESDGRDASPRAVEDPVTPITGGRTALHL